MNPTEMKDDRTQRNKLGRTYLIRTSTVILYRLCVYDRSCMKLLLYHLRSSLVVQAHWVTVEAYSSTRMTSTVTYSSTYAISYSSFVCVLFSFFFGQNNFSKCGLRFELAMVGCSSKSRYFAKPPQLSW
jgi:hypothetical protein